MSKLKARPKSPYVDFTIEEIQKAEAGAYTIQLGAEFFDYKDRYSFTLETAEKFYEELFDGLREMLNDPNPKKTLNRAEVLSTLLNLRILPLRIH